MFVFHGAYPRLRVRLLLLCSLLVIAAFGLGSVLFADPMDANDAASAVRSWLASDSRPLAAAMNYGIDDVQAFTDDGGVVVYYVVSLNPEGYVVVAADDMVEPIVSFCAEGAYDASASSPIYALVTSDLAERTAEVRGVAASVMSAAAIAELPRKVDEARKKWDFLLGKNARTMGMNSVSDVWVAPLVQSRWNQKNGQDSSLALYNYYTPPGAAGSAGNYVCGCVATSMSQLMRYFQYPTTGVGTASFPVKVSGVSQNRAIRGGDGHGGAYAWASMPLVPNASISSAQRQAIGALCSDAGVSVQMMYDTDGSSAYPRDIAPALKGTFHYANAISYHPGGNIGAEVNGMVNASLDSGSPVLLAIYGRGGHSIVCDGYGTNLGTQYHHLNMGWAGAYDVWYNLPTINAGGQSYTRVGGCVYNVFPTSTGEIISGRVIDRSGNPLQGVAVTATPSSGSAVTATSSARGIYALKVSSNRRYTVTARAASRSFASQTVTTGRSADEGACGNRWGVNFEDGSQGGDDLVVSAFSISNGASSTTSTVVTLDNICGGEPSFYAASERSDFSDASWQAYSADPTFTLSSGAGSKTVYFKVKDSSGNQSPVVNDTITLGEMPTLIVNGSAVTGSISAGGDADWFQFTASTTGPYTIETRAGTLQDNVMSLCDASGNVLTTDDDSGEGTCALISYNITRAGKYLIRVRAYSSAGSGTYTISVKNNSACSISSFAINGGAATTDSAAVTLNSACTGAPSSYMASEDSGFVGASWRSYTGAAAFTLSSAPGEKTVYFKVKTVMGTVSSVVGDTITMTGLD